MIWQLHHQFKDGHTEMISQTEIGGEEEKSAERNWLADTIDKYPLPEGAKWLLVNEKSPFFVMALTVEDQKK